MVGPQPYQSGVLVGPRPNQRPPYLPWLTTLPMPFDKPLQRDPLLFTPPNGFKAHAWRTDPVRRPNPVEAVDQLIGQAPPRAPPLCPLQRSPLRFVDELCWKWRCVSEHGCVAGTPSPFKPWRGPGWHSTTQWRSRNPSPTHSGGGGAAAVLDRDRPGVLPPRHAGARASASRKERGGAVQKKKRQLA